MTTDVDIYVGKRLRRRRRLLGLTQQKLAGKVGVRFQQIQKYECGANRITPVRLLALSTALKVDVNYFFGELIKIDSPAPANNMDTALADDILSRKETLDLVRTYQRLSQHQRRRLIDLASSFESTATIDSVAS